MPWRHHCDFPDPWRCRNFGYGSRHSDGDGAYPTNHCTCCCTYTSLGLVKQHPDAKTKQEKQKKIVFQKQYFGKCQCARLRDHPRIQPLHTWLHLGNSAVEWRCSLQGMAIDWKKYKKRQIHAKRVFYIVFKYYAPTPPSLYTRRASDRAWCRRSCSSCVAGLHNHMVFLQWSSAFVEKIQHCLSLQMKAAALLKVMFISSYFQNSIRLLIGSI